MLNHCNSSSHRSSKSSIRHIQSSSFVIPLGLLLSGDIQLNPVPTPSTFNIGLCTLNIRSLLKPITAISDLADTRNVDVFALTETWITPSATPSELRNATPSGFFLDRQPSSYCTCQPCTCCWWRYHFSPSGLSYIIKSPSCPTFKTFELSSVTLKLLHSRLTIFNVYRPPPATTKHASFSLFLSEFNTIISLAATTPHEFLITGDFTLTLIIPMTHKSSSS